MQCSAVQYVVFAHWMCGMDVYIGAVQYSAVQSSSVQCSEGPGPGLLCILINQEHLENLNSNTKISLFGCWMYYE